MCAFVLLLLSLMVLDSAMLWCAPVVHFLLLNVFCCMKFSYLFSCWWTFNCFQFRLLWIKLLWIFTCKSLCKHKLLFLLGRYLRMDLLGCPCKRGKSVLNVIKNCQNVFKSSCTAETFLSVGLLICKMEMFDSTISKCPSNILWF